MPNLSIKDVPEALAEKLRQRAARNHRSLQGELMALLEAAASETTVLAAAQPRPPVYAVSRTEAVAPAAPAEGEGDDLLQQLDAIVADSLWGSGPFLTREQAHDRRLSREFEYLRRQEDAERAKRENH